MGLIHLWYYQTWVYIYHLLSRNNEMFREIAVLHNGATNLHIIKNAQRCQGGITRNPKLQKLQKNVVWTLMQGSPGLLPD